MILFHRLFIFDLIINICLPITAIYNLSVPIAKHAINEIAFPSLEKPLLNTLSLNDRQL